ncbi:uncharacterized protein LOC111025262 isoform X2 [Momordica charantia]|uniref:Isopentenyl phosphate kinase n=1 Tax=Momordica charantia TaxID=3673 RepID=A0A6J1DWU0_MOMCH|nr:uncharacterized protein LOC111025262 isoform X2 [Momordica charantia]
MEEGNQSHTVSDDSIKALDLARQVRCIVKLGGAAITCKNELETIHEENLATVSSHLRKTMASKSGVHKGGLGRSLVKAGFVATRISVTSLNLQIVRALAREGIPSVGMSPFSCGWSTCERNIAAVDLHGVSKAINFGFVPVLHGDAVFDDSLGCTILSGDVIIRHLAEHLKPDYVVFLTDVLGVYDRPPSEPNAVLLREIVVGEDGRWSVLQPIMHNSNTEVEITVAAHDTTGGMVTKISEAAMIAKLGIEVYIVKAATDHSLRALSGKIRGKIPDDWLGTVIRFSR